MAMSVTPTVPSSACAPFTADWFGATGAARACPYCGLRAGRFGDAHSADGCHVTLSTGRRVTIAPADGQASRPCPPTLRAICLSGALSV